jgi:hypothetical protein
MRSSWRKLEWNQPRRTDRVSLSEEIVENKFSKEPVELESAAEWPVSVTGDEGSMGDQDDLPLDQHEELQPSRLHKENQPDRAAGRGDRGDKGVDVEVNRRSCQQGEAGQRRTCMSSREDETTKQQSRGAGGQLQEKVWDPGGFQQSWEAHEQELMNFCSSGV